MPSFRGIVMKCRKRNRKSVGGVTAGAMPRMTRRQFVQMMSALGALGFIDDRIAALAVETNERRLGWLANQDPGRQGIWAVADIEGTIPTDLNGTLFRTGPGQTANHGVTLRHLFDGDAFVQAYELRDGKVRVRGRFIETPQRMEEEELGRMIYGEFGTLPPEAPEGAPAPKFRAKNQPSVNVVPWDGRLLGLSEGGHPSEIDPQTLAFRSYWDYYGTLPAFVPHTAHPKFDPIKGVGYTYGIEQGPSMALTIFSMEKDGRLKRLHRIPQGGYYMIHDMMLTEHHFVFAIPPLKFSVGEMLSGKLSPAEALKFFEQESIRFLICRRDGTGNPVTIEQPPGTVYHNGNAFEKDGLLYLDSCISPDNSVQEMMFEWSKDRVSKYEPTVTNRLVIDLAKGELVSRNAFGKAQDFPRFDERGIGRDLRYLFTMENGLVDDPIAFSRMVRHDFRKDKVDAVESAPGRAMGETVFVPDPASEEEGRGWLLNLIYDAEREETALEIRDAESLEFVARAWVGTHFPLGFHGNFAPGWNLG
jgi:all-trans-8'-apo-beta-carotenal 15,15'-oxygenase